MLERKRNKVELFEKTVDKTMGEKELYFFNLAHDLNLTPKIISITNSKVTMERYDYTCAELSLLHLSTSGMSSLKEKISFLLKSLHNAEILHGDLHAYNIVVKILPNGKIGNVRLIDFEYSLKKTEITKIDIERLSDIWHFAHDCPKICQSIEELFESERDLWVYSFNLK